MNTINSIYDKRIKATDYMVVFTIGEYYDLVKNSLNDNEYQRKRVRNSGSIIKGCDECRDFRNSCNVLFRDISYLIENNTDIPDLYYKFRNQITHRYRNLIKYKSDLGIAVQYFERLTMLIVEKYPSKIED